MSHIHKDFSWLGAIPTHWQVLNLRQILTVCSEKNHPDMPLLSVVREKGVIVRNIDDKNHNYVPDDLSNYKLVKRGQFAVNKMKAWQGSYGVSQHDGIVSPAYFVFNINHDMNHDFFNKAIRSKIYVNYFGQASDGIRVGQWDLSMKRLRDIPFCLPPREEQEQIVRFLDWKVSAIDKLIAKHEKRIALLDELKGTLIDKTVILGIKNSEATRSKKARGEIPCPKHWKIQRMRESFTFRKGLTITKDNLEEIGIPVINYGQIHAKDNSGIGLNDNLLRYVNESYLESNPVALVEHGDFIFADTSEDVAGCGNCVYVDRQETIFAGYHSIIAHPTTAEANHKYLAYLFQSATWRDQLRKKVNGVKVYSITQKLLRDTFILLPPLDEQNSIVAQLDSICQKIRTWTDKLNLKIRYLQDLKPRLISDAVTGKIDVRSIKLPNFAKEE